MPEALPSEAKTVFFGVLFWILLVCLFFDVFCVFFVFFYGFGCLLVVLLGFRWVFDAFRWALWVLGGKKGPVLAEFWIGV